MGSTRAETSRRGAGRSALISRVGILLAVLVLSGAPIASATTFNKCLENERVENGLCAPCTGGGTRAAGDDPAAGDTSCAFPDGTALNTAVYNCLAVDATGVACCNHGADCGAAGTVEMPDWDVSLVTSMSSLFYNKGSFNGYIAVGRQLGQEHGEHFPKRRRVQPAPVEMGRQLSHRHARDVC